MISTRISICLLTLVLASAGANAAETTLDLPAALQHALRENPELKAKRHALGIAEGRLRQAGLLFQNNPRLALETEFPTSRGSGTTVELNLLQEFEVAGQRGYRAEAAAKNLRQSQLAIEDAERLLRLEVTQAFYQLLALQQAVADFKEVLTSQDILLQTAEKRFAREDITILELNTLTLDRDQARNDLATKLRERATAENELRRLLALEHEGAVLAAGSLADLARRRDSIPNRQTLQACSVENRPDVKAAKLGVEVRDAELRLAQARRIPNISLGPRYKRDSNQNLIGGEIAIPLPFFNRNQEEVATALASQNISKTELESRRLSIKQQLDAIYVQLALAGERLEAFGDQYLGGLDKILALSRKAYESGEMTIFEFSVTRDRFTKARAQMLNASLEYAQALAALAGYAPGCLGY
jgi:outer membrane protein, heavy metal efflux system